MNKKIIAIAIATAMAAPVAMADVKVSGQIGASIVNASKGFTVPTSAGAGAAPEVAGTAYRAMQDSGLSKIDFSGNSGDAIFKIGIDIRNIMGGAPSGLRGRDFWLGYKLGGAGVVSFGRMGSALAGLEGDKYNATFLELRRTAAVATTSNTLTDSFTASPVVQYTTKLGGASLKVQYDPNDKTAVSGAEGYAAIALKGKAGAIGYFLGYNNGTGTDTAGNKDSNMKVGASMKMGSIKGTLMVMNADNNGVKQAATTLMADMGMGNGLDLGFAYGSTTEGVNKKDTFMRLGVTKKLSKGASLFGGYVAKHDDNAATNKNTNGLGLGMKIKF